MDCGETKNRSVCFFDLMMRVKVWSITLPSSCLLLMPSNLQGGEMKARWSAMERGGENADERGVPEGSDGLYHEL